MTEEQKNVADQKQNEAPKKEEEALSEDELNEATGGLRSAFVREAGPIIVK